MNATSVRSPLRNLFALVAITVALQSIGVIAQVLDEPVKGFEYADYDKTTGKLKWILRGDLAEPIANDKERLRLTGVRMIMIDDKGNSNLVVTPRCIYNRNVKQVNSSDDLKVSTGDGRFAIEGVGFDFQQSDTSLLISNRVHATLHKDAAGARTLLDGSTNPPVALPAARPGGTNSADQVVHIYSDLFRFQTNLGRFRDNVRVVDPQGTLACGVLTIEFTEPRRQIDRIVAEREVVVESGETRATGDRGIYELASEVVKLSGDPTWRSGTREGSADELIFERKTRQFRAERNVHMRLPPGSLHETGSFLPTATTSAATNSNAAISGRRPVEVTADQFEYTPGSGGTNSSLTVLRGKVRIDDERGTLRCAVLSIHLAAGDNRTESVLAERDVVVERGEDRVTCERAFYFAPDERIEMTGNPGWQVGQREGTADLLRFDLKNRTYLASGAVHMKLPPGAAGNSAWLLPINAVPAEENPSPVTPALVKAAQPVEVFSDEFEFRSAPSAVGMDEATYRGHVRIRDPGRLSLDCGVMTGRMFPGSSRMQTVVADEDVVVQATSPQGERTARGDHAVYTAEREEVELTGKDGIEIRIRDGTGETVARGKKIVYARGPDLAVLSGDPRVTSPKGVITGDTVILDRANSTLKATGNWKMTLSAASAKQAAPPALPKSVPRRKKSGPPSGS